MKEPRKEDDKEGKNMLQNAEPIRRNVNNNARGRMLVRRVKRGGRIFNFPINRARRSRNYGNQKRRNYKNMPVNKPVTRFRNNTNQGSRIRNNAKVKYITKPYLAVLDKQLFSIFPSEERVLRFGMYSTWQITIENNMDLNVAWFPLGVGFGESSNRSYPKDGATKKCPHFCNLYLMDGNLDYIYLRFSNQISIQGKYRLIGASLKITNITNVTNRGGSFIFGEVTNEAARPLYFTEEVESTWRDNQDDEFDETRRLLKSDVNNLGTKQMFTADNTAILNYVNCGESNKIFNDCFEYCQAPYTNGFIPGHCESRDDVVGNSTVYVGRFYRGTTVQTYLVEQFQVVEIVPYPYTNMGNTAINSKQRLSNGMMKRILAYPKIIRS